MYKLSILDDEPSIALGIAQFFPWEDLGFSCNYFFDPDDFIKSLKIEVPDVLLSDIEMPGMDGIRLCEWIRNHDYNIKIVFLSSYQKYEYFRSAIMNKVEDYLLKPIKEESLLACFNKIRDLLDLENQVFRINSESYYQKIIQTVDQYLEQHFREATLEEAASQVFLSASYLSKIYKETCGLGFSEKLLNVRMEKAKIFLGDIRLKTYDIAYLTGYDNAKSFSRAFKNYYGITPTEYKNGGDLRT